MTSPKKLSIGITINLEHYENLRLEVEGEVTKPDDADALVDYLDGVLARFGTEDPDVRTQVESYRRRVLGRGPQAPAEAAPQATLLAEEETVEVLVAERQPPIEEIKNGGLEEALYHTPVDASCVGENADHSGERVAPSGEEAACEVEEVCEAAAAAPAAEVSPAPAEAAPVAAGLACDECGEAISKSQDQLSQLFTGRSLCKKCMEKLQG